MVNSVIRVLARVVAHPGKEDKLKALLLEIVEATRKEPGCITYELLQSQQSPRSLPLSQNGKVSKRGGYIWTRLTFSKRF
ncbi:MAG: antibiotic biosynthesis monooxygenase [Coleofasciculus sp. E2-BRE-01]